MPLWALAQEDEVAKQPTWVLNLLKNGYKGTMSNIDGWNIAGEQNIENMLQKGKTP